VLEILRAPLSDTLFRLRIYIYIYIYIYINSGPGKVPISLVICCSAYRIGQFPVAPNSRATLRNEALQAVLAISRSLAIWLGKLLPSLLAHNNARTARSCFFLQAARLLLGSLSFSMPGSRNARKGRTRPLPTRSGPAAAEPDFTLPQWLLLSHVLRP
jgi:hypothetical protein